MDSVPEASPTDNGTTPTPSTTSSTTNPSTPAAPPPSSKTSPTIEAPPPPQKASTPPPSPPVPQSPPAKETPSAPPPQKPPPSPASDSSSSSSSSASSSSSFPPPSPSSDATPNSSSSSSSSSSNSPDGKSSSSSEENKQRDGDNVPESSSSRAKIHKPSGDSSTPSDGGRSSDSMSSLPPPSEERSEGSSLAKHRSDSNLPLVLGVSLGIGFFLVLMIISLMFCGRKKKSSHGKQYYEAPQKGPQHNNATLPKWQTPGEYNGRMAAPSPQGGWHPLPLQAGMPNDDMNGGGGGFSGYNGGGVPPIPPSPNVALGFNQSTFTYDELAVATDGFSRDNILGQGGFGFVYKGVLPNRKVVAVKQLKSGSGQGEREFQAEVEIISRVHHRHLVSLVGYCIAGAQRMLVYEFVPNKTLEFHLHAKELPTMDWPTRLKIAIGSAKGLAYLHEDCHPRIIHRDIKTANILLDNNFDAMVADFGLAKLTSDTSTHVSTRVMGTFGYLAPEYASSGKLTEKSDVFSFAVMLLELITGRRPIDNSFSDMEDSLVDWSRPLLARALADGDFGELVDPRLENKYDDNEIARMAACAAAGVRHSARRRPRMSQIVRALEGDVSLDDLNEGVKPGQSTMFSSGSEYESSYSTRMKRFREIALGSTEYSNGYSGVASDNYGVNASESGSSSESQGRESSGN